MKASSS